MYKEKKLCCGRIVLISCCQSVRVKKCKPTTGRKPSVRTSLSLVPLVPGPLSLAFFVSMHLQALIWVMISAVFIAQKNWNIRVIKFLFSLEWNEIYVFQTVLLDMMQIHRSSQNLPPPSAYKISFLHLETLKRPFEKNQN